MGICRIICDGVKGTEGWNYRRVSWDVGGGRLRLGKCTEGGRGEGLAARLGGLSLHSPAFLLYSVVSSRLLSSQNLTLLYFEHRIVSIGENGSPSKYHTIEHPNRMRL